MVAKGQIQLKELTKVFASIHIPLLLIDAKTFSFAYANPEAQGLLGYSDKEIKELNLENFFTGKSFEQIFSAFENLFNSAGTLKESKVGVRRKNGRSITVNLDAQTMLLEKKYLLLTLHDISEIEKLHKQKENSIQQLSHLSKLADLGCIAAGVAHEVNNPLATVMLCIETTEYMLQEQKDIPEKVFEQFHMVKRSIQRISTLTQRMATLAREDKLTFKKANIKKIVEDLKQLYTQRFCASNIDLIEEIAGDFEVTCDSGKIEQVVINILNNAVYALKEKTVDRKVKISLKEIDDKVCLEIWNNGTPIPKDVQKRIFAPFFTSKPIGQGTGLGLPISYRIMQSHGGDLKFYSSEEGTVFILEFPVAFPIKLAS